MHSPSPHAGTIPSLSSLWRVQGGAVWNYGSATIAGTVFGGNSADMDHGNDVYTESAMSNTTLTCPSECPDGESGTCTPMSTADCYGSEGADCTCYSCECSSGPAHL